MIDADLIRAATEQIAKSAADPRLPGVIAGLTTDRETIYLGSSGQVGMPTDAVLALFSVTKSFTATAALALAEDGRLDLDAPAADYEPELANIAVLDGFSDGGTPRLRPPHSAVTTRQLLTHTAGFAYDFFDEDYARIVRAYELPDIATATRQALRTPLLFDPGTAWRYGANLDWAGLVIEAITGRRLGDVLRDTIFEPLGMSDTAFERTPDMRDRAAQLYRRTAEGTLKPAGRIPEVDSPEVHMGGQGLFSTVADQLCFLRMWLNDGRSDNGTQILRADTVHSATRDQLGELAVIPLPGVTPRITRDIEFFPGIAKGWNLVAMTNRADAPTGRPAGSMGWAGLANLYFWVDRSTRIAGFWATQLFPFGDSVAWQANTDFETAVYRAARR